MLPDNQVKTVKKIIKHSLAKKTFELSAVRLQPSMDKNGKNDNYMYFIYKNRWDYKMNILKRGKNICVTKLIVLF